MAITFQKPEIKTGRNSLALVEQRYQEAYSVGQALYVPREINGAPLCWQGRVIRAFDRAPSIAHERLEQYRAAVDKLCADSEAVALAYREAWAEYERTAGMFGIPIKTIEFEQCQCEGCQLLEAQEQRMREG